MDGWSAQVELYGVGGGPGHGGLHLPAGERQEAAALAPPLQRALQVLRTATVTETFFMKYFSRMKYFLVKYIVMDINLEL